MRRGGVISSMVASDATLRMIFLGGACLLVALRAWRGWRLGVARQLISLCALAAAYPVAYFGGPRTVPFLRIVGFPDPLLAVIGGAILGLIVFVLINLFGALLFKRTAQQGVGAVRYSYGLLGAFFGAIFGLMLVWVVAMGVRVLGTLAQTEARIEKAPSRPAIARTKPAPPPSAVIRALVEMKESLDHGTTGRVIDSVDPIPDQVYATLAKVGEMVGREESVARFLEYPGVRPLAEHPKVAVLQRDPEILKEVARHDYLALLRNRRIVEAANDPEVAGLVKRLEFEKALDYALRSSEKAHGEALERH